MIEKGTMEDNGFLRQLATSIGWDLIKWGAKLTKGQAVMVIIDDSGSKPSVVLNGTSVARHKFRFYFSFNNLELFK